MNDIPKYRGLRMTKLSEMNSQDQALPWATGEL